MSETRIQNDVNMDTRFIDRNKISLVFTNGDEQTGKIDAAYPLFIVFKGDDDSLNLVPWTSILYATRIPRSKKARKQHSEA